jgi:hypothetical protein
MTSQTDQWRTAWLSLAGALALHVADEALTGFLPMYNGLVARACSVVPWIPLPTFTFPLWLGGLIAAVLLMVALTPVVSRGARWIRVASLILAVVMVGNALGHIGLSLHWGRPAPGVYSAPVLLAAALGLLVTAWRAGRPEAAR